MPRGFGAGEEVREAIEREQQAIRDVEARMAAMPSAPMNIDPAVAARAAADAVQLNLSRAPHSTGRRRSPSIVRKRHSLVACLWARKRACSRLGIWRISWLMRSIRRDIKLRSPPANKHP